MKITGKYEKIKQGAGKLLNENDIAYIDWNVLTGDSEGANTKEKILEMDKFINDLGEKLGNGDDVSFATILYAR